MKLRIVIIGLATLCSLLLIAAYATADSLERLSAIASGGIPWDIMPIGIYGYLADRSNLVALNISDSLNPTILCKSTGPFGASGVFIKDTLSYIYETGGCLFWIGNIASPDTIIMVSWVDLPNTSVFPQPWGIEVVDTLLFVADGNDGLFIFNVKDPVNPTQIAQYDTPGNLTDFFILDTLIFCSDWDSLIILNFANPASPQRIGAVDIYREHTDVDVVWPYAYCTSYPNPFAGDDGSIQIVDVSNPSNPTVIGSFDGIRGNTRAVFVNDEYVYIASSDWWYRSKEEGEGRADIEGGVRIASGIIPDSLIISHDTPGDAREIFVRGNLVLVPDSDSLMIYYHHKTGIEEGKFEDISLVSKFSLYPNPGKNTITCKFQFKDSHPVVLSVYDEIGRKIREIYRGAIIPGTARFFWDGKDQNSSDMPAGNYYITVSIPNGEYSETRKLVYLGREK